MNRNREVEESPNIISNRSTPVRAINSKVPKNLNSVIEGSEISDNMDWWKGGKSQREEKESAERRSERRTEMEESRCAKKNTMFFQNFVAPWGSNSRLAKAAGAKPSGETRDEKLHAIVAGSRFGKNLKHLTSGALLEVEMFKKWWKVRDVLARSNIQSQNCKSTPVSEHFWKLRWWKIVRRRGA